MSSFFARFKRPRGFLVWAFEKMAFRKWRKSLRVYPSKYPSK